MGADTIIVLIVIAALLLYSVYHLGYSAGYYDAESE